MKVKIESATGVKQALQKILCKGKMLKDEDTLADRKIEGGTTITVVKGVDKDNNATSSSSSSASAEKPKEEEKDQAPVPCVGKCGFYGNPKTEGYCSKCWREKQEKEAEEFKKTLAKKDETKEEKEKESTKEDDDT